MSAQTPTGSCVMRLVTWGRPGSTTRPACEPAMPA